MPAEEVGQAGSMRGSAGGGIRFQEQPPAIGMAAVMKDDNPIAVAVEDVEDLVECGVGKDLGEAEAVTLGLLEDLLEPVVLGGQVAQVAALMLVGEGQDDDRQLGHFPESPHRTVCNRIGLHNLVALV